MSTGQPSADKTVIHWLEGVVAQAPDGGWCVWLNEPPAGVPQVVPLDRHAPGLEHAGLAHGVPVVVSLRERCGRWSAVAVHRSTPCERVPLPGGQGSPQLQGALAQAPDGDWSVCLNEPPAGVPQVVPLDRRAPDLEHAALAHGVSVVVSLRERCGRWSAFAIHHLLPQEEPLQAAQAARRTGH